jgi:succinoglycan biosynthesis protein ExoA
LELQDVTADSDEGLIVIPCLNEESCIFDVIAGVLRDPTADKLLIVIADGGSTDGTREIVTRLAQTTPNLRLMANPLRIQSAGVNLAARHFGLGRQWLVRMDAHAEYPEGFVSQLIAEARRTCASSVVVAMKSQATGCFQKAAAVAQNTLLGTGGSAHRRDGAEGFVDHGHHALFRMADFRALNGYDETQSHNEDAEFDCRLTRAGGRIWLTRATRIGYYPRATPGDLYSQYRNYGRGRATTILRHRARPRLRQLLPAGVVPSLAPLLATPWFTVAALPCAIWIAVCLTFGVFLGVRDRNRCAFASGFAAIVMHLGWSVGFWSALANIVSTGGLRGSAPSKKAPHELRT